MNKTNVITTNLLHEMYSKTIDYLFETIEEHAYFEQAQIDIFEKLKGHKKLQEYKRSF
jgi:hypothetical protein